MGAHAEMPAAADALDAGAYEFVVKPFVSYEAVVHVVERANERKRLLDRVRQLSRVQQQDQPVDELLGSSPAWRKARAAAMRAASTAAPILLIGEPGCGKEMLARMVHAHSQRRGSFVVLHCDVLAADATERELFGVVDGTSGGDDRGLVHAAEGGTLMLASVDALGARAQVRLMRLLQSGEPARGERLARAVDVRVIASCERDLKPLVESGSFRGDLFHQLAVIVLWLPALRRRRDDIPLLACHFLAHYARRLGKNVKRISPEALRVLREASWPGNVCELRNVVQRAVTTCCGEVLMPSDLVMEHALEQASGQSLEPAPLELPAAILDLPFSQAKQEATTRFERWYLTDLLQRTAGNLPEAARQSGLDRSSFRRLRRRCGEDPGE
jgi:DNA-binding NtrC family response regulator